MITLRLFHQADPFRQIEARTLDNGELVIGRDPAASWFVSDPDCELSRQHCKIACEGGEVQLTDMSANGVYVGPERRRAPRGEAMALTSSDMLHLGQFLILMEQSAAQPQPANDRQAPASPSALDAPFDAPMLMQRAPSAEAFAVLSDWAGAAAPLATRPGASNATLLDAFCDGARLDASAFAGEDPADVMRRIGAVYQQMVLGLGDLMSERTSLKAEYRMERTTVGASGNNPFKWAPTQRVAVDLLRQREDGFLSGAAALKASFEDLKKHLLCLAEGSRAAISAAMDNLSPAAAESEVKGQSTLFMAKSEACWRAHQKRHEELTLEARERADGRINRAFRDGYEQHLRALDELGTRA
ncbi:MAG: type VI secretion system-associated FHA domain protein TagH [Hyphomonadaceae bacterium]